MTKFTEKAMTGFPMAFYYAAMKAMDDRTAAVETELARFITMETEFHRLFTAFDVAYKNSLKSQLTDTIKAKDDERDHIAYVMERVAKLWGEKLDDQSLAIHGKRVAQVFKDFDFRTTEALVAENAKITNMEQRFAEDTLAADLAAMGLTELNTRLKQLSAEIQSLINQRSEEQSTVIVGELKQAREALDAHYRAFITYINAVQEIQPEEQISQAAQFYNQDIKKIEEQIAQSRKKKKGEDVEPEPAPDESGDGGSDVTPVKPE
ncbi:MAG: hypothetical protein IJ467_04965 [Bacteroidaceae bacterium]|nr:hypothetical protein [Bacteroidaceae bacterium]